MNTLRWQRLGLCAALALAVAPALVGWAGTSPAKAKVKTEPFDGKVVPLASLLDKAGIKMDADAAALSLALVTDKGKVYPLIKDDGSRMFFKDKRLLNRPMRLTGRLVADGALLQVVNVHSYVQGKLNDIYYWCDICSIRTNELDKCGCCGGPVVLREEPIK
jgi:hypothetical protein